MSAHAYAAQLDRHDRSCHYLPQFKAIYKKLPLMTPLNALDALKRYQRSPASERPDGMCEDQEVERLMTENEIKLVYLTDGTRKINAQTSMHCDKLDGKSLNCNGRYEDGTVFPFNVGIFPMHLSDGRSMTAVKSEIPGSELVGAYSAWLGELQDGKAALPLPIDHGKLDLRSFKGDALMVIFRGPAPWAYRKFVWYFD